MAFLASWRYHKATGRRVQFGVTPVWLLLGARRLATQVRNCDVSVGKFYVVMPSLLMHEGVVFFLDVAVILVVSYEAHKVRSWGAICAYAVLDSLW